MQTNSPVYLTGPQVRSRYQCSYQTIWRWMNDPKLGFPQPLKINNRNRFAIADLEAFERKRATASMEAA
jgi:predicted DNA-binding transcriptional regulator AlpA